jgi:hypothetical protein
MAAIRFNRTQVLLPSLNLKVADEVWLIVALLHRESPLQLDFSVDAIVNRARTENLAGRFRPSVYVHVIQHCVANRPPDPGRYRMLFETAPGHRRLFRPGDPYNLSREGSKTVPAEDDLPKAHAELLSWYRSWIENPIASAPTEDPLLRIARVGRHIWQGEDPDRYVRELREGWE